MNILTNTLIIWSPLETITASAANFTTFRDTAWVGRTTNNSTVCNVNHLYYYYIFTYTFMTLESENRGKYPSVNTGTTMTQAILSIHIIIIILCTLICLKQIVHMTTQHAYSLTTASSAAPRHFSLKWGLQGSAILICRIRAAELLSDSYEASKLEL